MRFVDKLFAKKHVVDEKEDVVKETKEETDNIEIAENSIDYDKEISIVPVADEKYGAENL